MFRSGSVVFLALTKVPESKAGRQDQNFDWPGGVLVSLGFGGIVLALIESTPVAARGGRRDPDPRSCFGNCMHRRR